MIECEEADAAEGQAIQLKCTKMKDDEQFETIAALMEKVELPGGRSSLVVGHEVEPLSETDSNAKGHILAILKLEFATTGAAHGELKKLFLAREHGSESTFNRGIKVLKNPNRSVSRAKREARNISRSVSVSPRCQISVRHHGIDRCQSPPF